MNEAFIVLFFVMFPQEVELANGDKVNQLVFNLNTPYKTEEACHKDQEARRKTHFEFIEHRFNHKIPSLQYKCEKFTFEEYQKYQVRLKTDYGALAEELKVDKGLTTLYAGENI